MIAPVLLQQSLSSDQLLEVLATPLPRSTLDFSQFPVLQEDAVPFVISLTLRPSGRSLQTKIYFDTTHGLPYLYDLPTNSAFFRPIKVLLNKASNSFWILSIANVAPTSLKDTITHLVSLKDTILYTQTPV